MGHTIVGVSVGERSANHTSDPIRKDEKTELEPLAQMARIEKFRTLFRMERTHREHWTIRLRPAAPRGSI